jgi:hypothetical protein
MRRQTRRGRFFPGCSRSSGKYSANETVARIVSVGFPVGRSTERPIDAGKRFRCFASGSAPGASSSSWSSPAAVSSSASGSSGSRAAEGARKPVRYHFDGAIVRTSAGAAGSNGPTRSASSADTRCSRTSDEVGISSRTIAEAAD